jgi:HSP90 family molecular chaperone
MMTRSPFFSASAKSAGRLPLEVTVELLNLDDPEQTTVVISDNGCGMSLEDVTGKWLSPAVDHKEKSKQAQVCTPLGRLPIGEKGVGRFAAHQMGRRLELVTRAKGQGCGLSSPRFMRRFSS